MSLNEEQQDHVEALARSPELACGCGWFFSAECESYCPSLPSQKLSEKKIRLEREKTLRRVCDMIDKEIQSIYPLQNIPAYERDNSHRNYGRVTLKHLRSKVAQLITGGY